MGQRLLDERLDVFVTRHVAAHGDRLASSGTNAFCAVTDTRFINIGQHYLETLLGERLRRGATDTCRCACD